MFIKKENGIFILQRKIKYDNYPEYFQIFIFINDDDLDYTNDIKITHKIIKLVQKIIPNSKLSSNLNSEIMFTLPAEDSNKFPNLFSKIDKKKDELKILNVGISITTIEEVFLRLVILF